MRFSFFSFVVRLVWGLLGYLLGLSGVILGSIFGLWGCLGLCFEGSGGPVGGFGGPLGAALAAQEAQCQIFSLFSLPF